MNKFIASIISGLSLGVALLLTSYLTVLLATGGPGVTWLIIALLLQAMNVTLWKTIADRED